jgi:hypothetical protein
MLDSLLLTELMVEQMRCAIEERVARDRLIHIALAGRPYAGGMRASIAAAIVRFGILLDGTAARRAALQRQEAA